MGEWRVPGFVEVRELGVGGQGRAVLVREDGSGRVAVVKYVGTIGDVATRDQFRQESVLLQRVQSPYVARWYGHYEGPAASAILMEAVDGVSLKEVLKEHAPLSPKAALLVLKGSLLGLHAAHELGVVHRDYKPANVIVRADGLSKLIDFGVATLVGERARSGTPAYMAPEQWRGEPATPATDVYAATCVFFECVTGHKPYRADTQQGLMAQHLTGRIPSGEVPAELSDLIEQGLAKAPDDRPRNLVAELDASASEMYGQNWESRGAEALATAAAVFAVSFPLAALLTPTAATPALGPGVVSVGARAGKNLITRIGGAKTAVAIAGAITVAAAAGVLATSNHPRSKSPTPQAVTMAVSIAAENETISNPHVEIRGAQYLQVRGGSNPTLRQRVNTALKAPLVEAIKNTHLVGPCPTLGVADTLSSTVQEGLSGPILITELYEFHWVGYCASSGGALWKAAVTVDLRTGQEITPTQLWLPTTLTPSGLQTLTQRLPPMPDTCGLGLPLRLLPLQRDDFISPSSAGPTTGGTTLFMTHNGAELIRSFGDGEDVCRSFAVALPYSAIRDLLRPEITAILPK